MLVSIGHVSATACHFETPVCKRTRRRAACRLVLRALRVRPLSAARENATSKPCVGAAAGSDVFCQTPDDPGIVNAAFVRQVAAVSDKRDAWWQPVFLLHPRCAACSTKRRCTHDRKGRFDVVEVQSRSGHCRTGRQRPARHRPAKISCQHCRGQHGRMLPAGLHECPVMSAAARSSKRLPFGLDLGIGAGARPPYQSGTPSSPCPVLRTDCPIEFGRRM